MTKSEMIATYCISTTQYAHLAYLSDRVHVIFKFGIVCKFISLNVCASVASIRGMIQGFSLISCAYNQANKTTCKNKYNLITRISTLKWRNYWMYLIFIILKHFKQSTFWAQI